MGLTLYQSTEVWLRRRDFAKGFAMEWITRSAEKVGAFGGLIAAASCPACLPALASLGAALGLGFLSGYEGLMITTLLPVFAGIALLANALGWFSHHQWHRSILGMVGPALVLAGLWLFFGQWWNAMLYTGLAFMIGVSVWDLLSPARRRCGPDGCDVPAVKP